MYSGWLPAATWSWRGTTESDNERKHPQNITASSVPLSILNLSTSGSQSLTLTYTHTHEYITPAQLCKVQVQLLLCLKMDEGLWRLATLCMGLHRNHLCHIYPFSSYSLPYLTYIHTSHTYTFAGITYKYTLVLHAVAVTTIRNI